MNHKESFTYLDKNYRKYHQSYFGKTQGKLHLDKLHEKDELNKLWSDTPLE